VWLLRCTMFALLTRFNFCNFMKLCLVLSFLVCVNSHSESFIFANQLFVLPLQFCLLTPVMSSLFRYFISKQFNFLLQIRFEFFVPSCLLSKQSFKLYLAIFRFLQQMLPALTLLQLLIYLSYLFMHAVDLILQT
jgi:hypothetical protein